VFLWKVEEKKEQEDGKGFHVTISPFFLAMDVDQMVIRIGSIENGK